MVNDKNNEDLFYAYKILENSLNILKDNYADLMSVIENVKKENPKELCGYSRKINQAIHNFAASVGTCIERERRFKKKNFDNTLKEESNQKIKELFSKPECEFADNLRNFILHYMLPQISWGFCADGSMRNILFKKDVFLQYTSWGEQAKIYIDSEKDTVDVIKSIMCYYEAFCSYYDNWLSRKVLKN